MATTTKRINMTVTRYDGDAEFPEAERFDEFCATQVAALYPGFEVECSFGPRTEAFVYGADIPGRDVDHEITSLLKVDLWDQFCTDGYKLYTKDAPTTRRGFLAWAEATGTTVGQLMRYYDGRIGKYTDPTEESREGLSYDEALAIAREDASLLYVDLTAEEEAEQLAAEKRAEEEANA